jgi:hypothetical protein
MQIKTITYGFKKNIGNYESKYVEVTAEIDFHDDLVEEFIILQDWVHSQLEREPNVVDSAPDLRDMF